MNPPNKKARVAKAIAAAVACAVTFSSNALAQQVGSNTRFPTLEGPVETVERPPLIFDALGNPVASSADETPAESSFTQAPGPIDRDNLPLAPPNFDRRGPTLVERARPLLQPAPNDDQIQRRYSRADYERALYKLALLEHLLRERARHEAAATANYNYRYGQTGRYEQGYRGGCYVPYGGWRN